jgi:hypothetical protein
MTEVWTSTEKGNDKLIGFVNDIIYKANPKTDIETERLAMDLKSGFFDRSKLWEIRTSYCKEIRLQEGKNYIEMLWGKDGEEQLKITDEVKRNKIFEFIKINTQNSEFNIDKYSAMRAGKKPMIAFFIVLALFLWTLFYAIEAESGNVYYIENGHYNSITGIVLGLASFGLIKVVIIFSILLSIAIISFIMKAKNPPIIHRIVLKK